MGGRGFCLRAVPGSQMQPEPKPTLFGPSRSPREGKETNTRSKDMREVLPKQDLHTATTSVSHVYPEIDLQRLP